MSQFPDEAHLSSWAGICPGNNESAGVRKSGKIRKGDKFLKAALAEAAWSASKRKGSAYSAIYNNIAKRRGKERALVALGHQILMDVYRALKTGEPYVDEGAEAVFQRNSAGRQKSARALSWFAKSFRFLWCSPMHPRTRKMAAEFGFKFDGIKVIESLGFLEFLQLEANVRLVLTDSGGVQEETCILGVLCVTLRDNTERPETLEVGANLLTGRRCKK